MDFPAQVLGGQVLAQEYGLDRSAQLDEGRVGGVLGAGTGEAAQDRLGLGGAQPQGGGVLDRLVVLLGDELPSDRPGEHRAELGPAGRIGGVIGPVQVWPPMFFSRGCEWSGDRFWRCQAAGISICIVRRGRRYRSYADRSRLVARQHGRTGPKLRGCGKADREAAGAARPGGRHRGDAHRERLVAG